MDVKTILLNKLENLKQQFPMGYSKSVYVLETVDNDDHDYHDDHDDHDDVYGQWVLRLQQAKTSHTGERIVLIPYHLGNFHWIGIVIKFKADRQIEHTKFIVSVKKSNFIPNTLQKQFSKVFPNVILLSGTSRNYADRQSSADLTIENLLKAVEEAEFMAAESPDTSHLLNQMNNDQGNDSWNREKCTTNKEYLSNMYHDFNSMPSCSERSVISLMYYVSLKLSSGAEVPDPNFPAPD